MTNDRNHEMTVQFRALGADVKLTKKGRVHTVDLRPLGRRAGNPEVTLLTGLDRLQELYLAGTSIDDAAIASLTGFPKLATLDLQQTALTDNAVDHLRKMSNLKLLLLTGTRITRDALSTLRKEMIATRIVHKP